MSDNSSSDGTHRDPLLQSAAGAGAFLILLALLSYFGYKLGEIEERMDDRLAYEPPVATTSGTDEQPVYTTRHARTIYVPVYSHIYARGGTPVLLETTLSIRNTDPDHSIVITSINYYDTKGNRIDEYLDGKLVLDPLESTEVLVKKHDLRGGSGANFMVAWRADDPVHLPVVQAVMIGSEGGLNVSFLSDGHPLTSRINKDVRDALPSPL